jgi:hypothetical protein
MGLAPALGLVTAAMVCLNPRRQPHRIYDADQSADYAASIRAA